MFKNRRPAALLTAGFFIGTVTACAAAYAQTAQPLHIDIPVKLEKSNIVFDVGHAVFNGDMPFVLGDLNQLANDVSADGTKGEIVTVFHGDAAYLVLNDETYNNTRHVKTGNPYAKLITGLMSRGIQFELCGATAAGNHWGNANLLSGVNINTDAMVRVSQLEQKGFTLIYQ